MTSHMVLLPNQSLLSMQMQLSVSFQHRTKGWKRQTAVERDLHEKGHAWKALFPSIWKLNKQGPEMNISTSQRQLHSVPPAMNFQRILHSLYTPTVCNLHQEMHPTPAPKRKETTVAVQYIFHSVFYQHPERQLITTNKSVIWVLCRRGGREQLLEEQLLACPALLSGRPEPWGTALSAHVIHTCESAPTHSYAPSITKPRKMHI